MATSKGKAKAKREPATKPEPEIALEPRPAGDTPALTWPQEYERNMKIVRQRVRGRSWSRIAEEAELTIRACQVIFDKWRETSPTLRHHDPMKIVDDLLHGYEAAVEDFEEAAELARAKDQVSALVGAINGKVGVYDKTAVLLQMVNVLPEDLGQLALHLDYEVFVTRMMEVLRRSKGQIVGPDLIDAFLEALGGPPPELVAELDDEIVEAEVVR